ncbi:MAG: hypothetical protein EXR94_13935 [Gemmatimonadetes bacterium]|nr:hypothetical protein [Gemmatimonadota bacterium]
MSTRGESPMMVPNLATISLAAHSRVKPNPTWPSASRTRVAFSSVGSIRMSMSQVARALPQSWSARAPTKRYRAFA